MLPTSLPGGMPGGMTAARPISPWAASGPEVGHVGDLERRAAAELGAPASSAQPSGTQTTYFIGPS